MNCKNCPNRQICKVLCREAELYVSQDEVRQRELLVGLPHYSTGVMTMTRRVGLSKRERQIVVLLVEGRSYSEISQILNITRHYVRNIVSRIKAKRR